MAKLRHGQKPDKDPRPVAVNDFIYDSSDDSPSSAGTDSGSFHSETPEEAIRKLRGRSEAEKKDSSSGVSLSDDSDEIPVVPNKRKVYSSGYILDDNLQPVGRERRRHPVLRGVILTMVTLFLLLTAGS